MRLNQNNKTRKVEPFGFLSYKLFNLENIEFEIIRFRYVPEDGMVGTLLARFDLTELDAYFCGAVDEHFTEKIVAHEMRAGAGCEIAASRKNTHGKLIDLLVTVGRVTDGFSAFCEGGRIENDEIIRLFALFVESAEIIENVGFDTFHAVGKTVFLGIFSRHGDGGFGNIDGGDLFCAAFRRIERKRARMREAVEKRFSLCKSGDLAAVVFLVEEEARFLSVFYEFLCQ